MSSNERPLAGMLQQFHGTFNQRLDDLEGKRIHAFADFFAEKYPNIRKILTQDAERELRDILSLRALEPQRARERLRHLSKRVRDGDLSAIKEDEKQKIDLWTARLCVVQKETLATAKEIRERLAKSEPCPDLSIIDALIREAEGDVDGALRDLRDVMDPDSRSVWFGILIRARGEQRTLEWFDEEGTVGDADFLSGAGWVNWAVASAKCGRWDDAAGLLAGLQSMWAETPALAIVEGSVNAAFLLPEEFRSRVLDGPPLYHGIAPIPNPTAAASHARSLECFLDAERVLRDRVGEEWRKHLADWIRWLRLMEPDADTRNAAREHLGAEMENAEMAVELVPFAHAFGIDYDRKPLDAYLERRRELGGLDDRSRAAEFYSNEKSMKGKEFRKYFERNKEHLLRILPPELVVSKHVASLLENGDSCQDARDTIDAHRDSLDNHHVKRLELLVDAYAGHDIRDRLERQYRQTDDTVDLQNLIEFLKRTNDREALRPLCLELFRRLPTEESAIDVVASLSGPSFLDHGQILVFLGENEHLFEESEPLLNAKSNALFHAGRYADAKEANERSKERRLTAENLRLGVNIAIASGNWAALGGMVTGAWGIRDKLDANELVWIAHLAAQEGPTRQQARQLLKLAAERAPDDAAVLAVVCWQYFRLGDEEAADPRWLSRAVELSTEEEGPIRSVPLRDIVDDWLPRRRKHLVEVDRKWTQGEIPIGAMAEVFNVSLSRVLLDLPGRSAEEADGRRRFALPVIAAGRPETEIADDWTVGVDVTSVLVLQYLGILDVALDAFGHVNLSPDILEHLFRERAEARFHQPSRIAAAKRILKLRDEKRVRMLNLESEPPNWLKEEAGRATAEVLQWARNAKGMAVCMRPIHAVGSLTQRVADLRGYQEVTISLTSLCKWLKENGKIDADAYGRIYAVLRNSGDTEDPCVPGDLGTKQFCFNDTALDCLSGARVLQPIVSALCAIHVHGSVFQEMRALVDEEDSEGRVVSGIE
ncbi:MAG: hypothetical protein OXC91_11980, partial [Rhodobacteraceae bacterium]|nr:hypothetical protein [Paracoccaceae bacterium]